VSTDVAWYIARDNQRFGPFTAEDFRRFEREGQLVPTDCVWHTGLDDWIAYCDYQRSRQRAPSRAARLLLRRALRFPADLLATAFAILRRPTEFAKARIDTGPRDLGRAVYFYTNIFVLSFVVGSSFTYLDFYAGASQPRELAWLAIQIVVAVPVLYLLNVTARQRVSLSGVAQGVLYADALFLVPLTLVGLVLSYLVFNQSISQREIDILLTEFEECVARSSFLYWLARGDLQFFMYLPTTRSAEYLEFARDYYQYALAVPFCVLFAKLLRGRYAAPVLLNTALAIIAFSLIVPGITYGRERIRMAYAHNNPCVDEIAKRGSDKYNPALLAKQIASRINVQLSRASGTDGPWVTLTQGQFVMGVQIGPGNKDASSAATTIARGARSIYCESNTDFRFLRALGMPLFLVVRDEADRIVLREEITPSLCPRGRSAR
jgi:hypothetical protein